MSDPRPTAMEVARSAWDSLKRGDSVYVVFAAAIEADRAASDAREDRLREALEAIASNDEDFPPDNMHLRIARAALAGKPIPRCGCRVPGPGNGNSKCMAPMRAVCRCRCHREAAIPPGSDR